MRMLRWGIAFLGCLAIIGIMNNWFVHRMIYPAPGVTVPDNAPQSYTEPEWDLDTHGWLYEPPNPGPKQVMLYFHGNGENLETLRQSGLLQELEKLGIPFLVVDYPGYGRSKGKASEQNILHDGIEAAKWLKTKYHNHSLILCGWSLGASVALQTAAKAEHVDGLIAMSIWTSLRDVAVLHFSKWLVGFAFNERFDALHAAKEISFPSLFIHGELDNLIPVDQGKQVAEAIKTQARWVTLRSAGHNDLLAEPVVWSEIAEFLKSLDRTTEAR